MSSYIGYLSRLSQVQLDDRLRRRVTPSDIVQESLLEAHRDFAKFSGQTTAEFTGWLRKILIHNIAREVETHILAAKRDIRREHERQRPAGATGPAFEALSAILADRQHSPASEVEHREELNKLALAIESLAPAYRDVIVMRHVEGLSFRTIAAELKRSPGATRMLWLRAIERLRESMA